MCCKSLNRFQTAMMLNDILPFLMLHQRVDIGRLCYCSSKSFKKALTTPPSCLLKPGKTGSPAAWVINSCCGRRRPLAAVCPTGGGSQASVLAMPSNDLTECAGWSQNCEAMAFLTSCRLLSFSGTSGMSDDGSPSLYWHRSNLS